MKNEGELLTILSEKKIILDNSNVFKKRSAFILAEELSKKIIHGDIIKYFETFLCNEAEKVVDFLKTEEHAGLLYRALQKELHKKNPEDHKMVYSRLKISLIYLSVKNIDLEHIQSPITQKKLESLIKESRATDINKIISEEIFTENSSSKNVLDYFKASVLEKLIINIYAQENQDTDAEYNLNENFDFREETETYKLFIRQMQYLNKIQKKELTGLNKALSELRNRQDNKELFLSLLKEFRTDRLMINLNILGKDTKTVNVEKLSRIIQRNEKNHTLPVSVYLKLLQIRLSTIEFRDINDLYLQLSVDYLKFYSDIETHSYINSILEEYKECSDNLEIRYVLEDVIIPFFYKEWYFRKHSTFTHKKNTVEYGMEGAAIRKFVKKLDSFLTKQPKEEIDDIFLEELDEIVNQYCNIIDLPPTFTNDMFDTVVYHSIDTLNCIFTIIEKSTNKYICNFLNNSKQYIPWKRITISRLNHGSKILSEKQITGFTEYINQWVNHVRDTKDNVDTIILSEAELSEHSSSE